MFTYAVYGLTIASEIEFPELLPALGPPDVRLTQGVVPEHLEAPLKTGVLFEASCGSYLLRIAGVARYWARDGKEVLVEVADGASALDVRTFFLGSVLTALLHQRGRLVLHAGGVVGARGAVLIAGHSGHGKSTLLAALAVRGYRILTDDAGVITLDDAGRLWVHPGFPQLQLWKDALARLGYSSVDLRRPRSGIEKYALPLAAQFALDPHPLSHLYVLGLSNDSHIRVDVVQAGEGFTTVRAMTRNHRVLEGLQMHVPHFRLAAAVASSVPITRITRPRHHDTVGDLADQLGSSLT